MSQTNIEKEPTGTAANEERLRAEVEELKRQLAEQQRLLEQAGHGQRPARPSSRTLWMLGLLAAALVVVGFLTGYIPRQRRESLLVAEASARREALPTVTVAPVARSKSDAELVLPGSIQALSESPVLARADGYIKRRYVDIGDRVSAGQLVAEIEAPELDQQVRQAEATLAQARSSLEQTLANLEQGRSNEGLARVTAERWRNLTLKGAVSRQENDQYQTQYMAQSANVQALEKAVAAARSNVGAAEANLARLTELQGYMKVRAPFAGVITVRNIDAGTLVTAGSTLLFRIAQSNMVRTYVNVPQSDAASVRVGQTARLSLPDLPGRSFEGRVTRTANALDPATRTLLAEVQVPNASGLLLPGMYTLVDLKTLRKNAPLLIPGDALVVRGDGPQAAVVGDDHVVHFERISLGRDYGTDIEVLSGLRAGQNVVINPGDSAREGAKVNPVLLNEKTAGKGGSSGSPNAGSAAGSHPKK